MDQTEFNHQNLGFCHELLISILPIDCPVCKGIDLCIRLLNFSLSLAPSILLLPRIFEGLLDHVLLILQRLHDSVMQFLVTQAIKPVTLGSFKNNSSIEISDFHASGPENGIGTTNDQTIQLALHQDPSLDYQPMIEESQAKEVDDSAFSMLTDTGSYDYPRDDKDLSQPHDTDTTDEEEGVEEKVEKEEKEKVAKPTVMQKVRAPKKTVSINEDVEIFPISETKKTMSKEWSSSSSFGNADEKSKPLKSILKVGSKLTDVNNE